MTRNPELEKQRKRIHREPGRPRITLTAFAVLLLVLVAVFALLFFAA